MVAEVPLEDTFNSLINIHDGMVSVASPVDSGNGRLPDSDGYTLTAYDIDDDLAEIGTWTPENLEHVPTAITVCGAKTICLEHIGMDSEARGSTGMTVLRADGGIEQAWQFDFGAVVSAISPVGDTLAVKTVDGETNDEFTTLYDPRTVSRSDLNGRGVSIPSTAAACSASLGEHPPTVSPPSRTGPSWGWARVTAPITRWARERCETATPPTPIWPASWRAATRSGSSGTDGRHTWERLG